jgi:hypothetical protein
VAAAGSDTWHVVLDEWAYSWTSTEVTHVTIERVTRGRVTSEADVIG